MRKQINQEILDEPRPEGEEWALAKHVLRQAFLSWGVKPSDDSIGWVRFLGDGLDHFVYTADCIIPSKIPKKEVRLVVRLPKADPSHKNKLLKQREIRVLEYLGACEIPFRIPKVMAVIPVANGPAMVQEMVYGVPLELRAPRNNRVRPWEVVARAAAKCHEIYPDTLSFVLPFHPTRRDHARSAMVIFDDLDIPESTEARTWCEDHMLPEEPSRLLHGDLLGQNILLDIEDNSMGIIDWSQAQIGDPSYDLAIVTRGKREPFQVKDGLEKLIEAYNAESAERLTADQVHFYELCLLAGFYNQDVQAYGLGSPSADNTHSHLRNFLQRIKKDQKRS